MSFTPYLLSVAAALRQQVLPGLSDPRRKDTLEACIRALTGAAQQLEHATPDDLAALVAAAADAGIAPAAFAIDHPPENVAVTPQSAGLVKAAVDWIEGGGDTASDAARRIIAWEHGTIHAKVLKMFAAEDLAAASEDDAARLKLDPAAIERYFAARGAAGARVTDFRQAVGGRSRQTAVFTLEGDTGLPSKLVIQRDHPASISRRGVVNEYPVLRHLATSTLKCARPLLLETERAPLGAPFMVLEQVGGSVACTDYFRPPQSEALGLALAGQLAILHAIDPAPVADGLTRTVDRATGGSWEDELDRLEQTWHGFAHAPSMTVSAAFAWMRRHVHLVGDETAIIHNDAVFHNILADGNDIVALLDWEIVHLGHPGEDLGYARSFIDEMADWGGFVDAYVAAGGTRFPREVLDYFSLRATIHMMTLLQYGRSMFKSGATSDVNLAEVATNFMPKLLRRTANTLAGVMGR